jgi:hypothetical protein
MVRVRVSLLKHIPCNLFVFYKSKKDTVKTVHSNQHIRNKTRERHDKIKKDKARHTIRQKKTR